MEPQSVPELFPHLRIVMGMVIGLGITRLLMGVAGLVQHPQRARLSPLHLLWAASILVELIFFWWWEFALFEVENWTFGIFLFIIGYAVVLFLLAALLFPDSISEYDGYEDFFLKRRYWFFGLFAATFAFDIIDTLIKGPNHWREFGWEYYIQVPAGLVLSAIAIWTANRRYHLGLSCFTCCSRRSGSSGSSTPSPSRLSCRLGRPSNAQGLSLCSVPSPSCRLIMARAFPST